MKAVGVRVVWDEEKLTRLPRVSSYSTVARFPDFLGEWPQHAWSIVLEFDPEAAQARSFEARARFLVADAPEHRLTPGRVFELYEGAHKTATVTVL